MNKIQQKCVYVVGAGFSAGLGYPLTNNLLVRLWDRIEDQRFKEALKRVIRFHNPCLNCTTSSSLPNVEELLSQMVVNEQLFNASRQYEGNFTKDDLKNLQRDLLLNISDWFHEISKTIRPNRPDASWLKAFCDRVMSDNAVIISFNWDLVLDKLLFEKGLDKHSYGFSSRPPDGPILLKPHGSLNWFEDDCGRFLQDSRKFLLFGEEKKTHVYAFRKYRAPVSKFNRTYSPLIVPPVLLKNFEKPVFKKLWQNCTHHLSTAKKIFFLGYSMPAADFHAQFIMRCGFHNQVEGELLPGGCRAEPTGAGKVIVINPHCKAAKRIQGIAGPRHKFRWISTPIAKVRLDRL